MPVFEGTGLAVGVGPWRQVGVERLAVGLDPASSSLVSAPVVAAVDDHEGQQLVAPWISFAGRQRLGRFRVAGQERGRLVALRLVELRRQVGADDRRGDRAARRPGRPTSGGGGPEVSAGSVSRGGRVCHSGTGVAGRGGRLGRSTNVRPGSPARKASGNGRSRFRWTRGRDRRGGSAPGRPRTRGEGLLQGHPSLDVAGDGLRGADEALRRRPVRGRRRDLRLRPAVRRAGYEHRPQRLARGGPADRGSGDHRRPPVRLRSAGHQLRRRPDRLRRPRRRDRRRRRAHGPHLLRRRLLGDAGARLGDVAGADGALRPGQPGPLGGDDRRQVGDPPLRARRARRPLPPARRPGHRGGAIRARDHPVPGQRRHLRHRSGDPPRHRPRGAEQAQAGLQGGRQDHRRQQLPGLRRRRRASC